MMALHVVHMYIAVSTSSVPEVPCSQVDVLDGI